MIKAAAQKDDGTPVFIFGLSAKNIEDLKAGMPIDVNLTEMGHPGKMLIYYGETEEQMVKQFMDWGLIGPTTIVRDFHEPT